MIRHSSSFFISIIFHIILIVLILYGYKNINFSKKETEKKVKISLCNIQKKQEPIQQILETPKVKQKPTPKVNITKPKKVRLKKVFKKPKIIKKEIIQVKEVIKEEEIKEEEIKIEIVEEKIVKKEPIIEHKKEELVNVESEEEKTLRLEKDYMSEHIQKIVQLLQDNLYYPRSARKRGITGEVLVEFKLSSSGEVHSIEVTNSQSDILSRAAIKTIQNLSNDFPIPSEELLLHVPINYTLSR